MHFGVNQEAASQILLEEPIVSALRNGDVKKLKKQEGRTGFFDVLRKTVLSELDKPQRGDGVALAEIAATIGGLDAASKPIVEGVWKDLRGYGVGPISNVTRHRN